ncbi:MAG: ATP-binding protein [Deltaproteobacteria bacterium]|nr:ATP-binding protein [Deltaproteobacteria bacterium]
MGKSHLAQALGHRAVMRGHSALFINAEDFLSRRRDPGPPTAPRPGR